MNCYFYHQYVLPGLLPVALICCVFDILFFVWYMNKTADKLTVIPCLSNMTHDVEKLMALVIIF